MFLLVMFVEYGLPFLVFVFVLTQLLIPLFRGTPLFPQFRSDRRLELELEKTREELEQANLKLRIAKLAETRNDVDINTSRLRGEGPTEAEYDRMCRKPSERKSDN